MRPFEITDLADPVAAYEEAREQAPVALLPVPGMGDIRVVTRYAEVKAMLGDPRFELNPRSFLRPPGIPEECQRYMHTMSELDGPNHQRLRRLVSPGFTVRRSESFRPVISSIVAELLDALPANADLVAQFARPLPMDVICALVGIPEADRPRWRTYGAAVAGGVGRAFVEAVPHIIEDARAAVVRGDGLLADLAAAQSGDRLTETELVTHVWHLVLAGQTPTNLITNAVEALLTHPRQLALLRADPGLMPRAVEEFLRWCTPQLLSGIRYAREDVEVGGVAIAAGSPVTGAIISANRDPRVFPAGGELDVTRDGPGHLAFSHGPHFCVGAALARIQTEVALSALLERFPDLALTGEPQRAPDPGTWRLASLPVRVSEPAAPAGR